MSEASQLLYNEVKKVEDKYKDDKELLTLIRGMHASLLYGGNDQCLETWFSVKKKYG